MQHKTILLLLFLLAAPTDVRYATLKGGVAYLCEPILLKIKNTQRYNLKNMLAQIL